MARKPDQNLIVGLDIGTSKVLADNGDNLRRTDIQTYDQILIRLTCHSVPLLNDAERRQFS
ncbi:MAG: hypothetical protein AAGA84_12580, partial [Pseudomonadota bacterium]